MRVTSSTVLDDFHPPLVVKIDKTTIRLGVTITPHADGTITLELREMSYGVRCAVHAVINSKCKLGRPSKTVSEEAFNNPSLLIFNDSWLLEAPYRPWLSEGQFRRDLEREITRRHLQVLVAHGRNTSKVHLGAQLIRWAETMSSETRYPDRKVRLLDGREAFVFSNNTEEQTLDVYFNSDFTPAAHSTIVVPYSDVEDQAVLN